MLPPRRPICTPPGTPRLPQVPVCRPMPGRMGGVTPFGGPASGISTAGGVPGPAIPSGPAVIPGPVCLTASMFADCFGACVGTIPPGTVCGWTFSDAQGVFGGQVNFTPGSMELVSASPAEFPAATKTPSAPISIFNLTDQFKFTEGSAPPGSGLSYQHYVVDSTLANGMIVGLDDSGFVAVAIGPVAAAQAYTGTWTPNNGTHVVHVTTDGSGVPMLWIDGVLIPLTPAAISPLLIGTLAANTVSFFFATNVIVGTFSMIVNDLFLTAGNLPPSTVFCCPAV